MSFDSKSHIMKLSDDGTYTAYSVEYDEHYHSTKDGALNESLYKHVNPTFELKQTNKEINILDICFGLGFNTLATLYYYKKNSLSSRLNIYSPELDEKLVESLKDFTYPKEFDEFKHIIEILCDKRVYSDENFHIEIFLGDAREYVRGFENKFDIVYQDAFSPSVNPTLWTREYFYDIKKSMKDDGVLSTYSTAFRTRLALFENGFNIYMNSGENFRDATIASPSKLRSFKLVDMRHKILCNPDKKSLRDNYVVNLSS